MGEDGVLDDIFLEYFQTIAELREARQQVSSAMKSGFWEIARARIAAMTNQQVCPITSLSYDMNMKAAVKLELAQPSPTGPLSLEPLQSPSPSLAPSSSSSPSSEKQSSGPRRRKVSRTPAAAEEGDSATSFETPPKPARDPLLWFGFSPSPALRTAQRDFKASVPHLVHIARLQLKLRFLESQFLQLGVKEQVLA